MKKKSIHQRIERIFAHAAALQQNGRLKNTIYCFKNRVYILNQDHTVLLKFLLRSYEYNFEQPMSFEANDYDSPVFEMEGDKICFIKRRDGYERKKSCKTPYHTPIKIAKLFKIFSDKRELNNCVSLNSSFLGHLEEGLSHIEFKGTKEGFIALQRNIYSGTIITIKRDETKKRLIQTAGKLNFKTVGLRTNDFIALFSFSDNINLYFTNKDFVWVESKDPKMLFTGIISQCVYDQLGKV